jgi:hypothetical protein
LPSTYNREALANGSGITKPAVLEKLIELGVWAGMVAALRLRRSNLSRISGRVQRLPMVRDHLIPGAPPFSRV